MGIKDKLQDSIIRLAIRKVIEKSNKSLDFNDVISKNGSIDDTNKKLVIRITDMGENAGLGIQDGKLVEVDKVDKPDTIFSMDKNTFSAILLKKLDHRQAFFYGVIETDGENWVRDGILLSKVFDEIRLAMENKK